MSIFNKILVPYDGSSFSEQAFHTGLEIASKFDSNLVMLQVLGTKLDDASGVSLERAVQMQEEQEKEAVENLKSFEKLAKEKNVKMAYQVIHDPNPAKGIVNYSNSQKIDLIVMASHGRTGFSKILLGSVASGVIQEAKCPVTLIKGFDIISDEIKNN